LNTFAAWREIDQTLALDPKSAVYGPKFPERDGRGRGPNFWHKPSGNSLSPNPEHAPPKEPHWHWHQRGHKGEHIGLRRLGNELEFWSEDLLEWLPIEMLPVE